jgi:hypothetical protein
MDEDRTGQDVDGVHQYRSGVSRLDSIKGEEIIDY